MEYRKTADEIQSEMLKEIDDSYEKSKGYFLWDILKAISIRIKELLIRLQDVSDRLDVEQLSGIELERFIYQRTGLKRKEATRSAGILKVTGNGTISIGDFFETEGIIRYQAIEKVMISGSGNVQIESVLAGSVGNVPANVITRMPVTIPGISACNNQNIVGDGYDAESDADLLKRYYERLQVPATSGNKYHYRRWALEVAGVGDAKVFPLWNGNNTVKVLIINQDRYPASDELVELVQNYIDPGITGNGSGEAPIGAFCTVASAIGKSINITAKVTLASGYEIFTVNEKVKKEITDYLASIAFQRNYLSYAMIGTKILNVEGVLDYKDLTLNGVSNNIECLDQEVMILGSVELNEQ